VYLLYTTCIKTDRPFQCLNGERLVSVGLLAYRIHPTESAIEKATYLQQEAMKAEAALSEIIPDQSEDIYEDRDHGA
jgi:hypothetical protein